MMTNLKQKHYHAENKKRWLRLRKKKAKEAKKLVKKTQREYANEETDLSEEFDATDRGRELLKEYSKEIRRMENTDYFYADEINERRFNAAERAYLTEQGKYVAEQMIKRHGKENAAEFCDYGRLKKSKDFVNDYAEENLYLHSY